uniref:Uncharacterized protein n=1 Tax=uncultured prokaryote TaxID=198431 RepID=A0A0H5PXY7_9ZZZZ|nr:hypothetical protein [uncultured prokaryote]
MTAIKDGRKEEIEVKWDSWISKSGAMFFELLTNIQANKPGWATYTEADYIFYGDAIKRLFYVFPVPAMRGYLKNHLGEYETRIATDFDRRTGATKKQSLGAIVPLVKFQ